MRIESSISIKYLFATKPFIPKEFRTEDGKRMKLMLSCIRDINIKI